MTEKLKEAIETGKYSRQELASMFPDMPKTTLHVLCSVYGLRRHQAAVFKAECAKHRNTIRKAWAEGMSDHETAALIGVTAQKLARMRKELNFIAETVAERKARLATVTEMFHAGKTDKEIADAINITTTAVRSFRRRNGLVHSDYIPSTMALLAPYFKTTKTLRTIATESGKDRATVRKYRKLWEKINHAD